MERLRPQNLQSDSEPDEATKGSISDFEKIGKYEVSHEIGRGGMSIVYKARDPELNRLVAIKLMLKSSNESLNLLRFQQEARAASQLDHPNIVKVHDFSTTDDGTPYLVMSYLNGISLADAIKNEGCFSLGRWLSIMIQACDALEHTHLAGVVHRDIKPSNFVLAQENGTEVLKLVDFGIAKNSFDDMSLTKTGEIFGSPLYMSPEQCAGAKLDLRSDIYSLGCVMYEALAGRPPISGANSLDTLQKHLTDKPDRLSKLNLKTNNIQQLDRIVMRCLEKSPDDRYQNLGDLKKELELLLQGQNIDLRLSSAINIPVVVACVVACLAISTAYLTFGRIDNHTNSSAIIPPSGRTAASGGVVENPQSSAMAKKAEFEQLRIRCSDLSHKKDFGQALPVAQRLAVLASELNLPPFYQAEIHIMEATCEMQLKHIVATCEHYEEALALMTAPKSSADLETKYTTLMRYGKCLRKARLFRRADVMFQLAVDAAVQQKDKKHECSSLQCLGESEEGEKKYGEALVHQKRALELNPTDPNLPRVIEKLHQDILKVERE